MLGRKPKPAAQRRLEGNTEKRPIPEDVPVPATGIPQCPAHLDEEARAEWARITPDLDAVGMLSFVDKAGLAAYCQEWSRWVRSENEIAKDGAVIKDVTGKLSRNPWVLIGERALAFILRFAAEFGMTPSARMRVKGAGPAKQKSKLSAFIEDDEEETA